MWWSTEIFSEHHDRRVDQAEAKVAVLVTVVAIDQLVELGASLQQRFTDDTGISAAAPLRHAYEWLSHRLGLDEAAILLWVRQNASELTRVVAGYTLSAAQSVAGAVMSFVFIIFAMFLLFRDGDQIVERIPDLLPFERVRTEALLARARDVIYGSVYGVVVIAIVQGALCGGIFWILGIPSAALWGMNVVGNPVLLEELVELLVINAVRPFDLPVQVRCPRTDVVQSSIAVN